MPGLSLSDMQLIKTIVREDITDPFDKSIKDVNISINKINENVEHIMAEIIKNRRATDTAKYDIDKINGCLDDMKERRKENKTSLFAIMALVFTFIFGFINVVINYYKLPRG